MTSKAHRAPEDWRCAGRGPGRHRGPRSLLLALAARSGEGDLDEAVALARRVVADTPPDDPDLSRSLSNLAYVLNLRYGSTGATDDRAEAVDVLRSAARTGTGAADVRLHAARDWGRLAALAGDAAAAAQAFALGVKLLPVATPRRLERPDAQRRPAEAAGRASDAAGMSSGLPDADPRAGPALRGTARRARPAGPSFAATAGHPAADGGERAGARTPP
ncbi:hypothetical protein [Streptomyces broussonetiae]|uniref:Tetratricopeptide repeat protein n=1 Tax=Streptomyces broussonetiae TaxID=2686304 RepID=A0ABV5EID9_9ACTN